jgi:hypothetical protein
MLLWNFFILLGSYVRYGLESNLENLEKNLFKDRFSGHIISLIEQFHLGNESTVGIVELMAEFRTT